MIDDKVSVIMPAYNCAQYVEQSIRSVERQSYRNWELLVANDGSTDDTLRIARAAAHRDRRIKVVSSPTNRGAAAARNAAIAAASGRYIAFLDGDDLWKPQKLERQLAFMHERDLAFSFTSYDRMTADGRLLGTRTAPSRPIDYRGLLKSPVIGCLTAIYDASKVGKLFMPDLRPEDLGLWLRLLRQVDYAHPLQESHAIYRVHRQSVSANKLLAARDVWRIYRKLEGLSLPVATYNFAHYAARGLLERLREAIDYRTIPLPMRAND